MNRTAPWTCLGSPSLVATFLLATHLIVGSSNPVAAATTYTWVTPVTGTWTSPTNWSPPRNTPAPDDVLVFDGGTTPGAHITNVPNQPIGRLVVLPSFGGPIRLTAASSVTLSIVGEAGSEDFDVPSGANLWTDDVRIRLAIGATGLVSGSVDLGARLEADQAGALIFGPGSIAVSGGVTAPFGTTVLGSVVFQAGATYEGVDPFGTPAPNSVVSFETGSLYRHTDGSASLSGRTCADFEWDSGPATINGTQPFVVDDLTSVGNMLSLQIAEIHIRGNVRGGALRFNRTSAQSVYLDGDSSQTVDGAIEFHDDTTVWISNPSGVAFGDTYLVGGSLRLDQGDVRLRTFLGTGNIIIEPGGSLVLGNGIIHTELGAVWLSPGCEVSGGNPASYVDGQIRHGVSVSGAPQTFRFDVGDSTSYAPADLTFPSVSNDGTVTVTTSRGDHVDIDNSGLDPAATVNRTWAITNAATVFAPCDATFHFPTDELDPGTSASGLVARKFDAPDIWTETVTGERTATSTQATGVASFSDFQLGFLPWELIGEGFSSTGFYAGSADWGDWDNDGDLDLIVTDAGSLHAHAYRNLGGAFSWLDFTDVLPAVWGGSVSWGDYDGDGLVDVAVAGVTNPYPSGTTFDGRIYLNEPGGMGLLENTNSDSVPLGVGDFEWVDFDNDGDLDLAVLGNVSPTIGLSLLRNDAGAFHDAGTLLPGAGSTLAAADYDRDGDMDLLASGTTEGLLYRNQGGQFADALAGLPTFQRAVWGDFDNDGWPDIAMARAVSGLILSIYRSEPADPGDPDDPNRVFVLAHQTPGSPNLSVIVAGDYDNDGRLDIAGVGAGHSEWTKFIRNEGGWSFSIVETGGPQVSRGTVTLGDYDSDGDLDLYFIGLDVNTDGWSRVLLNHLAPPNTIPTAPTGLSAEFFYPTLTLHWNASTDAETPSPGLSYNVRLGTTPGGSELMAGMADPVSGYRRVVRHGNAGQNLSWSITRDSWSGDGPVYFAVQAIDAAFAGSAWSDFEVTDVVSDTSPPTATTLHAITPSPVRGTARVEFDLAQDGRVRLEVFDVSGRLVALLRDDVVPAGRHIVSWNAERDSGRKLGAGIYFIRLDAGDVRQSRTITLLD